MNTHDGRGILYPVALPTFHRLPPPQGPGPRGLPQAAHLHDLVRWFWVPEWSLPAGRVSRQHVISYPASNLVVEPGFVALAGPTTRRSHRDLEGQGWAVGALLRPAGVRLLVDDPGALRDDYRRLDLPDLHAAVVAAMTSIADGGDGGDGGDGERRRQAAVEAFGAWLSARGPAPDEQALMANAMADLVDGDPEVLRVEQVAAQLGVSVRTVQRLARRYVGVSPAAMIRRRRLQEAAERLRSEPGTEIAAVAAELGYADQAHLATDFRTVLGFTPSTYRRGAG